MKKFEVSNSSTLAKNDVYMGKKHLIRAIGSSVFGDLLLNKGRTY